MRTNKRRPAAALQALVASLIACMAMTGCIVNLELPTGTESGSLQQKTIRDTDGFSGKGKILLIDISGVLGLPEGDGFFTRLDTVTLVTETLKLAEKDDEIKAVVLRIDTPGGGVTASDLLYRSVKQFKQARPEVDIHAAMLNVAASGGYYVAVAADEISAHPTTITGSIGVIAQFPYVGRLTDMIGVEMRTIKSGDLKDTGSLFEEFSPEEQQVLQAMIDEFYETFLDAVEKGRPKLERDKLREYADGRIYTGKQAEAMGLIDQIEYLPELIERIEEKHGGSMRLVTYDPSLNQGSSLYAAARPAGQGTRPTSGAQGALPNRIDVHHRLEIPGQLPAGFYYLWAEGR